LRRPPQVASCVVQGDCRALRGLQWKVMRQLSRGVLGNVRDEGTPARLGSRRARYYQRLVYVNAARLHLVPTSARNNFRLSVCAGQTRPLCGQSVLSFG